MPLNFNNIFSRLYKVASGLGISGSIRTTIDLVISRVRFPGSRIIRRPNYIRNEGKLSLGRGFSCGPRLIIDILGKRAEVKIGNNVMAYHGLHIGAVDCVEIGDNVLIASDVYISDHSHGSYTGAIQSSPEQPPVERRLISNPVKIGSNVWIGEKVSVLPGVTIGKGSIIGAGSVVSRDIPDYTIAVGTPATAIKTYCFLEKKWLPIMGHRG